MAKQNTRHINATHCTRDKSHAPISLCAATLHLEHGSDGVCACVSVCTVIYKKDMGTIHKAAAVAVAASL